MSVSSQLIYEHVYLIASHDGRRSGVRNVGPVMDTQSDQLGDASVNNVLDLPTLLSREDSTCEDSSWKCTETMIVRREAFPAGDSLCDLPSAGKSFDRL